MLQLGNLSALLAAVLGALGFLRLPAAPEVRRLGKRHAAMNAILLPVFGLCQLQRRGRPDRPSKRAIALLLVAALVPAAPIRAAFPDVSLLSAGGRAPLVAWFSRVRQSCYRDAAGSVRCTRAEGEGAYAELTLMLLLRDRACSCRASRRRAP